MAQCKKINIKSRTFRNSSKSRRDTPGGIAKGGEQGAGSGHGNGPKAPGDWRCLLPLNRAREACQSTAVREMYYKIWRRWRWRWRWHGDGMERMWTLDGAFGECNLHVWVLIFSSPATMMENGGSEGKWSLENTKESACLHLQLPWRVFPHLNEQPKLSTKWAERSGKENSMSMENWGMKSEAFWFDLIACQGNWFWTERGGL